MKNQEQEYMIIAHGFVENVKVKFLNDKTRQDNYQGRVQSSPVLIHDTGLMQTLAFYISKDDDELELLASHLLTWLNHGNSWKNYLHESNWNLYTAFMTQIEQTPEKLMMKTGETLKLLQWLKRFSEAQLKKD